MCAKCDILSTKTPEHYVLDAIVCSCEALQIEYFFFRCIIALCVSILKCDAVACGTKN